MKITIDQAEIETAIKNHIQNIIAVKPGQEISVDFRATRGESGATADINIVTSTGDSKPAVVTRTVEQATQKPAGAFAQAAAAQTAVTETKPVETQVEENPALDPNQVEAPRGNVEVPTTEEAGTPTTVTGEITEHPIKTTPLGKDEPTEEVPSESRSLFRGMERPKND